MFKELGIRIKILVVAIVLLPSLFVGWAYAIHVSGEPNGMVLATSDPSAVPCVALAEPVTLHQCVSWEPGSSTSVLTIIPGLLLLAELCLAVAIYVTLRHSQRLLLLSKTLLITAAVGASLVLVVLTNLIAQPHSQQAFVGASRNNSGAYVVDDQPAFGYGPLSVGVYALASIVPIAGLVGGAMGMASADQKKYAGMRKEKLFQ